MAETGNFVLRGDPVAEVESEKAVFDIVASADGFLNIVVQPGGDRIAAGTVLATISVEGETADETQSPMPDESVPSSPAAEVEIVLPSLAPSMETANLVKWRVAEGSVIDVGDIVAEVETDKATLEVEAPHAGVVMQILVAEGTNEVPVGSPIAKIAERKASKASQGPAMSEEQTPVDAGADDDRGGSVPPSTPLARRVAADMGVELGEVKGTGARGRITRSDVEDRALAAPALTSSNDETLSLFPIGTYETVPHDGMRKTIARRLLSAKQTVPHFYVSMDCRLDELLSLRGRLNEMPNADGTSGAFRISVNDMVVKAHALALRDNPEANVSWTDAAMLRHRVVDVGVAVSVPGGLITPIIRGADSKPLSVISHEMKDLASRARARKLAPDEFQGGTTSVSNLGMFAVGSFAAIVNPPHATILAVGAGERRPVVVGNEISVATMMTVTLSTDHRAVDGALAARVLGSLKLYIEQPMAMLA